MRKSGGGGFTLIELLTVIAIISMLAALTFVGITKVMTRAKTVDALNDLNQLRTALTAYYTEYGTYPPAYGYVNWDLRNLIDPQVHAVGFHYQPYMARLGHYANFDLYDRFGGDGYDTNQDDVLGRFEFQPLGTKDLGTGKVSFQDNAIYLMTAATVDASILSRLSEEERPYVYIPVYLRQFKKVKRYYYDNNLPYAQDWDWGNPLLSGLRFPAPKYDAYVLISMGPNGNTNGLVTVPLPASVQDSVYAYHINALQIYFLATRDANDNSLLDFDYTARTQKAESNVPGNQFNPAFLSSGSDTVYPDAPGPMIFVP